MNQVPQKAGFSNKFKILRVLNVCIFFSITMSTGPVDIKISSLLVYNFPFCVLLARKNNWLLITFLRATHFPNSKVTLTFDLCHDQRCRETLQKEF